MKESTPATSSVASIPQSHANKTNSSVKIDDTESVAEEVEQSRTHSVLSKKEDSEKAKAEDDDVPEEITEEADAPVDAPEEIEEFIVDDSQDKSTEEKSDTANKEQELIAEEIDVEQGGDTAVPNESEQPTEEPATQHTESPITQPEEVEEEIKVHVCTLSK